jgi:hypothetical protein
MATEHGLDLAYRRPPDFPDATRPPPRRLLFLHPARPAPPRAAQPEEEIFYPAARDAVEDEEGDDLLDEAEVEHAGAKDLIAQIVEGSASDALYDAKVKVLGEYIAHHVKEEETGLFPKVRKADIDLEALGDELSVRKAALLVELEQAAAP